MSHRPHELTQPGWAIVLTAIALAAIGVAGIYVTDTHYASGDDGPINAAKQGIRIILGMFIAGVVIRVGYQGIGRMSYWFFAATVIPLIPLFIGKLTGFTFGGLVEPRNGAYRWIHFPGFPLQPSEFVKIAYIVALAWYLRDRKSYRRFTALLIPLSLSVVPFGLILLQPDLGMVVLMVIVMFAMLFLSGAKTRHIVLFVLVGVALLPIAWGQIKGYQRLRISAVLLQSEELRRAIIADPESYKSLATKRQAVEWAASSGYQLVHSKNAIGSGGLLGSGWGKGIYVNSHLLPDRHNDFIFAIIGHQWGFVGCLVVLACFAIHAVAGGLIASVTTDPFGRLVAGGLTALLITQVLVNVGMTIGLMPITGMTLPFVSYGGSSLLTSFIAVGLMISVSQHRPFLLALHPFDMARRKDKPFRLSEPGEVFEGQPHTKRALPVQATKG